MLTEALAGPPLDRGVNRFDAGEAGRRELSGLTAADLDRRGAADAEGGDVDIVEEVVERAEAAELARESLGPGRARGQLVRARGDEAADRKSVV